MIRLNLLTVIVAAGFLLPSLRLSESLRFELNSGHTKCIAEDIKAHAMTLGKYHIVNPNEGQPLPESHKITVTLTARSGVRYHLAEVVQSGQFAFTAVESGDYMACFWVSGHKTDVDLTVDLDWKTGVAVRNWVTVAKKGQIDIMKMELNVLYETVNTIHEEMFYLREREEEMQELNSMTNSKMAWLSVLSLFMCLSVAGLQLWHLKTFFEKKKLI